jgi:hypothetical protein
LSQKKWRIFQPSTLTSRAITPILHLLSQISGDRKGCDRTHSIHYSCRAHFRWVGEHWLLMLFAPKKILPSVDYLHSPLLHNITWDVKIPEHIRTDKSLCYIKIRVAEYICQTGLTVLEQPKIRPHLG